MKTKIEKLKIPDDSKQIMSEIQTSTPQIRASLNEETITTTSANLI